MSGWTVVVGLIAVLLAAIAYERIRYGGDIGRSIRDSDDFVRMYGQFKQEDDDASSRG